jgi:hypothetical protein
MWAVAPATLQPASPAWSAVKVVSHTRRPTHVATHLERRAFSFHNDWQSACLALGCMQRNGEHATDHGRASSPTRQFRFLSSPSPHLTSPAR